MSNEIKYIKNTCYWFAKNNWNDQGRLRKCRDGSLCKFYHLTGQENNEVSQDWNALVDCPSCLYKASPIPEHLEESEQIMEKVRREMPCSIGCKEGKVLKRNLVLRNAAKRNWCDCSRFSKMRHGTTYYNNYSHPSGEKDTYVCNKCNCIQQVG